MSTSYETPFGTVPRDAVKPPCVVMSTSDITLSGEQTIASVSVVADDRVCVGGQTDATENGMAPNSEHGKGLVLIINVANFVVIA